MYTHIYTHTHIHHHVNPLFLHFQWLSIICQMKCQLGMPSKLIISFLFNQYLASQFYFPFFPILLSLHALYGLFSIFFPPNLYCPFQGNSATRGKHITQFCPHIQHVTQVLPISIFPGNFELHDFPWDSVFKALSLQKIILQQGVEKLHETIGKL